MNSKIIIIKIFKYLILTLNKLLSIFKLILVPIHYYTPLTELKIIPNHKLLEKADFSKINYDQSESLLFLDNLIKHIQYFSKLDHFNIGQLKQYGKGYGYLESIILQSMIAKIKPTKIIEIGSGVSTFCMISALKDLDYEFEMLVVDPFVSKQLEKLVNKNSNITIIKEKAENVQIRDYLNFNADFLFIDTSHAVRPLGDVDFIYNRLLPKINNCIIHIHDIFFPYLYQSNLKDNPWYQWSETQLLYCYLTNNIKSKIILDTSELFHNKKEVFTKIFPNVKLAKFEKGLRIDKDKNRYFPASIYLEQ
ncbi:class I SAM-dependent methyltransferase [Candidatus Pelagibacter bacterium]|nr:class I SAM-dependent methyltransferase [Candidatus Pelagibacter bacterium]